jgi:hypothetical protein
MSILLVATFAEFGGLEAHRPSQAGCLDLQLHDAFAQNFVFSGQQILGELVTTSINVSAGAGKVIIDSHTRRSTEIIGEG